LLPSAYDNDVPLRHGYTVGQARSICLGLLSRQTWHHPAGIVSFEQRLEVAWHAIIEHLYASGQPPSPREMMQAATRAVNQDVQGIRQFHGRNTHGQYAGTTIKGFERYWWFTASPAPSPENKVTDRIALAQIWPRLHPTHQAVLTALAAHGDHGRAAASLGISRRLFTTRLSDARQAFLKLWHEGESPSRVWTTGKTTAIRRRRTRRILRAAEAGQRYQPRPAPGAKPKVDLGISDAELARRYQAGESIRQLAAALGTYYSVVHTRLLAEGTQLRPPGQPPAR
jgi:Helix-turn-helix domain